MSEYKLGLIKLFFNRWVGLALTCAASMGWLYFGLMSPYKWYAMLCGALLVSSIKDVAKILKEEFAKKTQ